MSDKTRDAIAQTAKMVQEKTGVSSSEARAIVERAREQGDRKRQENKR